MSLVLVLCSVAVVDLTIAPQGLFLPDSFKNPRSAFLPRRSMFTERELHILQTRVLLDDPTKGKKKKHIGLSAFKKAVSISDQLLNCKSDPLHR